MREGMMAGQSLDQLAATRQKLEAKLKEVKAAEEAEKNKKLIAAGEAVLAEADANADFQRMLTEVLSRRLKSKRKRDLFDLPQAQLTT